MRNNNRMSKLTAGIVLMGFLVIATSCAVILGKDEPLPQFGFSFRFVETLRNEASLRGEGLKEVARNTDRATTLQQPNSVFADALGVYVTDSSPARIFVFDRGNRKVSILEGTPPPAQDAVILLAPGCIVVDSAGTMFVSDAQQGRVFGYAKNGAVLFNIGRTGDLGLPTGLAVDNQRNRLYVADTHSHKIKVFNTIGTQLPDIGSSGRSEESIKFPGSIALDRQGNLHVLDTLKRRVQVYDVDGNFSRGFNLSDITPGFAIKPKGIAVDSDGHVYVTDSLSNNIMLFDKNGLFLFTWGRTGGFIGEFWTPSGIFIDDHDTIYIADQMNGRIQIFQYTK